MGIYNVRKIENWLEDFTSEKNKFTNTYYDDYKNSYIRTCSDSTIKKMCNKLNQHYYKISKINSKISSTWNNYLEDLKAIDGRLAGNRGSVNDSIVASKLSKLPTLKEYSANLYTKINSASAVVGTAEKLGWSENKDFADNLSDSIEIIGSSAVVVATSVKSGMAGLEEDIVDGALWLGTAAVTGTATLFGEEEWANNAQDTMMDVISYDVVGEANKALYEKTSLGRKINEKSILKYDSEVAQNIQSVSTKATEVAAATALTVATGGAAAPVAALIVGGTGFLVGAGDKAQEDFSKDNRNFWENSKEIAISGGIKAVEFYSEGQMGAGAINAVGAIKSAGGVKNLFSGIKTALVNGESNLFTKDALKNGIKATFKDVDTYMDSLGAAFDNITYDNENGIQIDWKGLAKETACNFAMNSVFGFVGNAFETKMTSGMKNMELDLNTNNVKNTMEGVNPKNVEISSGVKNANVNDNPDILKKEYNELMNWKNSDKFLTDEAYYKSYGNRVSGNSYKKNMERIAELEEALIDTPRINKVQESLNQLDISLDEKNKITKNLCSRYKNARINANGKYKNTFMSYRDHAELHVLEVADYSKNMAQKNIHLNNSDVMEVYFAGLTHDLGMEDSMVILNKETNLIEFASDVDGLTVRKNHPLNSASIVLQEKNLLPKGMDSDKIALLTLTHSKSTSGITDFSDKNMWIKAIDNLDDAARKIDVEFDVDRMKNIINDDNSFKKITEQAVCLRDGDAMSKVPLDNNGNQLMQTGQSVTLVNNKPRKNFNDIIEDSLKKEMESIDDILSSGEKIDDIYGKAYHIGENNVRFTSDYTGEGKYVANVYLVDANNVPNASAMVIKERVGEINTYGNIGSREMQIHLPNEAKGTDGVTTLGKFYENYNYDNNASVRIHIVYDL